MTLVDFRYKNRCSKFGGVVVLDEQIFNGASDVLPISTTDNTNTLKIDFTSLSSDLDLSGQLPTNLSKGSRVILRKIDNSPGRILWSDGVVDYKFINRSGDYLELWWTGSKYII